MKEHDCKKKPKNIKIEFDDDKEWDICHYIPPSKKHITSIIEDIKYCPYCGEELK